MFPKEPPESCFAENNWPPVGMLREPEGFATPCNSFLIPPSLPNIRIPEVETTVLLFKKPPGSEIGWRRHWPFRRGFELLLSRSREISSAKTVRFPNSQRHSHFCRV